MLNENIDELDKALKVLNIKQSASAFHGLVCGHITLGDFSLEEWLFELIGEQNQATALNETTMSNKEAVLFLTKIIRDDIQRFNNGRFLSPDEQGFDESDNNFTLILPDEDTPVNQRLKSFADWCDGFLYTFGITLKKAEKSGFKFENHSVANEIIQDISQFAKIDYLIDDEHIDNDLALMEIVEYTQVGLSLIYAEITKNKNLD